MSNRIEASTPSSESPLSLTPAQVEAKAEALGATKASMDAPRCFVLAMLAGAFIALGALFFMTFLGDVTLPFGVQRVVGGLCFCLGLVLVLCCGAELFTGNILMVASLASRRISLAAMLRSWALVWAGNLCGALVVVLVVYLAHVQDMNAGFVGQAMLQTAVSKVTPDWITLFFKGILCNALVCLAVWIGYSAKTVVDKVIGILLPITAFVACGFEHCVANMFFLPMGMLLSQTGFPASIATDALTISGVLLNISAATLGNIVGGAIIGIAYWFAYRSRG